MQANDGLGRVKRICSRMREVKLIRGSDIDVWTAVRERVEKKDYDRRVIVNYDFYLANLTTGVETRVLKGYAVGIGRIQFGFAALFVVGEGGLNKGCTESLTAIRLRDISDVYIFDRD